MEQQKRISDSEVIIAILMLRPLYPQRKIPGTHFWGGYVDPPDILDIVTKICLCNK